MKVWFQVVAVGAFLAVTGVAYAQTPQGPDKRQISEERQRQIEERKAQIQQQREELLQSRKDALEAHRDQLKQHRDQMIADRRELMEQLRDLRKQLHDEVTAGKLTQDQARQQLIAWRKDHKPTPPDATTPRPSSGSSN